MILRWTHLRPRRTWFASLMLALTLLSSGMPLLHGAAHAEENHHASRTTYVVGSEVTHLPADHDVLHQDDTFLQRFAVQFAARTAPAGWAPVVSFAPVTIRPAPVPVGSSRAPPPGDPTRAPPFA